MSVPTSYLTSSKNLGAILDALVRAGVPPKVTTEFLKNLGFASSNDRPVPALLKAIGFLDASGAPTDLYKRFRNPSESGRVLAEALRDAYADLFTLDQNAYELSAGELRGMFMRLTGKQERVAEQMATTFRALASRADFSAVSRREDHVAEAQRRDATPGPTGDVHPLIMGLMRELPPPGAVFSRRKQRDWLEIAEATFRLIYEDGGDADDELGVEAERAEAD